MAEHHSACPRIADCPRPLLTQESRKSLDLLRNTKFVAFCTLYVGSFQHFLFNIAYPRLFPGAGWLPALKMVATDAFVHTPLLYFPVYYALRATFRGESPLEGLDEYMVEGWVALKACWVLWIPAQFVNFYLVPRQYRIVCIAVVGFVWEIALAYLAPMVETAKPALEPEVPSNGGATGVLQ